MYSGISETYPTPVFITFHQGVRITFSIRYEAIHNFKFKNKLI